MEGLYQGECSDSHARTSAGHLFPDFEVILILASWQIWRHIVREETEGKDATEINLPFRSKSVYYYWHIVSRDEWRLADNPIDSARKFLEREEQSMHVKVLDVTPEAGMEVLAFEVTDFMDEWAHHTQELAMDSTCTCILMRKPVLIIA